jgi:hypothetical protein
MQKPASPGQVQEEELDSCRAAGERGPDQSRMWVQGETEAGSPCAILAAGKNERRQVRRLSERWRLRGVLEL